MSETPIDPHKRHHAYCLPFGAHLTDAGHARYRFWAPSLTAVQLLWFVGHGAVSLLISRPHFPWADRDDLIERLERFALVGLCG